MIKIPNETKQFSQPNDSTVLGNIGWSLGLDLTSNKGRIRVGDRTFMTYSTADDADFDEAPTKFVSYKNGNTDRIWMIGASAMWYNSGNADDTFTQDATASTPTVNTDSDMALFNGAIYVMASNGDVVKYNGTWSTVSTAVDASGVFCQFANRLYGTQLDSQVFSINTSDVVVEASGTPNGVAYTLQLSSFGVGGSGANTITSMVASSTRIWIGTMDRSDSDKTTGRTCNIFEWDGASTQPNNVYKIDSLGIMAMIIKDDIPYAVDADGRLLKYNGGSFVEVARLPIKPYQYLYNPYGTPDQAFMSPHGITIRDGRILILISGYLETTSLVNEKTPSGVWEYDENIGLYHKHAITATTVDATTEYNQNTIFRAGALFHAKQSDDGDTNGDIMIGAVYSADNTFGDTAGVFVTDTESDGTKMGYMVTPWIESQNIEDTWQKIYAVYGKSKNATSKIVVSYRTDDFDAEIVSATWTSTTTFTTTDSDVANYSENEEIEVVQGANGGVIGYISTITENAGTYTVTLKDAALVASGTSLIRFQNFKRIDTATMLNTTYKEFSLGKNSTQIQFRVTMYFKGDEELHTIQIVNKTHLPTA